MARSWVRIVFRLTWRASAISWGVMPSAKDTAKDASAGDRPKNSEAPVAIARGRSAFQPWRLQHDFNPIVRHLVRHWARLGGRLG